MKNNNNIWVVVVVSLIVAVIASVITASITGNVIRVAPTTNGTNVYTTNEVYTKGEVDIRLKNIDAWNVKATNLYAPYILNTGGTWIESPFIYASYTSNINGTNISRGSVLSIGKLEATDSISSSSLARSNFSTNTTPYNAYVCVDRNGRLYRSIHRCGTS